MATLLDTRAATTVALLEPESGQFSAGTVAVNDTTASGGKAIRFPAVAPPAPTPVPPPSPTPNPTPVPAETWTLQSPAKTYSYKESPIANGLANRRFELRAGDIWANDSGYSDGRQRVEMRGRTFWPLNQDVWFSYAVRWNGSMPTTWTTMTQFHMEVEGCETSGKPPAFSFAVSRGNLQLLTRSDTRSCTTSQVNEVSRYSMPLFAANTWQHFVVRVKFNHSGSGSITFWQNGVQKYNSGPIPVGYNDAKGPYFKHGIYRGKSDMTTVMDYANVEISTNSLQSRITNPWPLP